MSFPHATARPWETARRFLADERGSITVEMVLWIPILLFVFMFTTTLFFAMDSRLDALRASVTVTDIVSRETEFDQNSLINLAALNAELLPNGGSGAALRVSSIRFEGGNLSVQWSECIGDITALTDADIPLEFIPPMAALSTVILTESYVPYTPISNALGFTALEWVNRKAVMPRFVPAITNPASQNCQNPLPMP